MLERKKAELLMSVVLILCACILAEWGWKQVSGSRVQTQREKKVVVIDAGHGDGNPSRPGRLL